MKNDPFSRRQPRASAPRLIWVFALLALGAVARAEDPKPLKVLLITGGCCHDYAAQKEILATGLKERAHVDVTVVHQGGSATNSRIELYENEDWAKGYDVVIHDECFADVKDPAWTARILKPHREGTPAVLLHCAMHCYRDGTDEWFKFCGVTSHGHGKHYPHEVLTRDGEHPIMKTLGPGWYSSAGELYHIAKLWPTAHALAASKNQESGKDEVCAWTNEYGKTRVFGSTLGHHNEVVASPQYLDLVTRGTLWAANKLNDEYLKPPGEKLVPVNLALKKKATASSEESAKGNLAPLAVDGKLGTRWCANGANKDEWLSVDLGKPEKLAGCNIVWEGGGAKYTYKVEGSADGKEWKTLAESNGAPSPNRHEFAADGIKHVRVTYLGSSTGAWGSIQELEIFGTEMVVVEAADERKRTDEKLAKEVKVPAEFDVTIFAAPPAVNYPVFVAAAPNGDLFVAADKNGSLGRNPHAGSVLRVRDVDGDGRADEVKRFIADIDSPRGLVWDHDRLYLMHPPHLSVFIDKDRDGIADEQQILVKNIAFDLKGRPADHTSNGVTLGVDGKLYLAIGDFGFLEAEGTDGTKLQLRGGGVVRVDVDGKNLELYSRGTRNILEASIDPLLNGFSRDNTNDGGGWDIRLHHYTGLEDHGYPRRYMHFNDEVVQPLADYGGGSGCGGLFLSEPGFPGKTGHALYTCDWGRGQIFRHPLTPKGATFEAKQEEFANVNRVTDMDVDANSRLYIASWKNGGFSYSNEDVGYLVRVTPKGFQPPPLMDYWKASDDELVAELKSPSHRRRVEAQRMLLRRGLKGSLVEQITAIAKDASQSVEVRVAAIFTLRQGLGAELQRTLVELAKSPEIQEFAIRALTDRRELAKNAFLEPIAEGLESQNARVRLQAAVAAARTGRYESAAGLLPLLADPDPVVRHTVIAALVELNAVEVCLKVIDRTETPTDERRGALRVLQSFHTPAVIEELVGRLKKESDDLRAQGLFAALCRLYYREGKWKGDSWGTRPDTTGPYYQRETWEQSSAIATALKDALDKASGDAATAYFAELSRHSIKLDGGVEKLVALAKNDPKLIPIVAGQLAKAEQVSAEAVPFLVTAAEGQDFPIDVRSHAVIALAKANHADGVAAILRGLLTLEKQARGKKPFDEARDAVLNAAKLENHLDQLAKLADDKELGKWADAVLLSLSSKGSTEGRARANEILDAAWNSPARRIQVINAVTEARFLAYRSKVLAAVKDEDKDVAAAAKLTAAALKFDKAPFKIEGPKIAELKPDDVVAAAIKEKGDAAYGEELFVRLSCVKCHTTKASEPPRGPFLGTIANTYKRKDLAEAVIFPSKTLAQGFVTNQFLMDDGRVIVGFVIKEAADAVTIRDVEGNEKTLPTDEIEERKKLTTSIMPEGVAKELTIKEFASLIDFIEGLAKK